MTRRLLLSLLLLTSIAATLPGLVARLREAAALRKLPMHARRERLMGELYRGVERVRAEVPAGERLAIAVIGTADNDESLFFNYYLYPHPTHTYPGLDLYRGDPKRPKTLISLRGAPHVATYAELRALGVTPVLRAVPLGAEARTRFVVPLVAAIDGIPPDAYSTEGGLEGRGSVTLTLYPAGVSKTIVINGKQTFSDLVWQCFGRMDTGWLDVRSDVPLRAAFWFVNRGRGVVAELPLLDGPPSTPMRLAPPNGAKVWLLNFETKSLTSQPASGPFVAPPNVYPFASEKLADGNTRFTWPEPAR